MFPAIRAPVTTTCPLTRCVSAQKEDQRDTQLCRQNGRPLTGHTPHVRASKRTVRDHWRVLPGLHAVQGLGWRRMLKPWHPCATSCALAALSSRLTHHSCQRKVSFVSRCRRFSWLHPSMKLCRCSTASSGSSASSPAMASTCCSTIVRVSQTLFSASGTFTDSNEAAFNTDCLVSRRIPRPQWHSACCSANVRHCSDGRFPGVLQGCAALPPSLLIVCQPPPPPPPPHRGAGKTPCLQQPDTLLPFLSLQTCSSTRRSSITTQPGSWWVTRASTLTGTAHDRSHVWPLWQSPEANPFPRLHLALPCDLSLASCRVQCCAEGTTMSRHLCCRAGSAS